MSLKNKLTEPQFSNPLRRASWSTAARSAGLRSFTRNELVKTCGRWMPDDVAAAASVRLGAVDDATSTRTTLASRNEQTGVGDVPALQQRETDFNMARRLGAERRPLARDAVTLDHHQLAPSISDSLQTRVSLARPPLAALSGHAGYWAALSHLWHVCRW